MTIPNRMREQKCVIQNGNYWVVVPKSLALEIMEVAIRLAALKGETE